jgi:hypothetical protein
MCVCALQVCWKHAPWEYKIFVYKKRACYWFVNGVCGYLATFTIILPVCERVQGARRLRPSGLQKSSATAHMCTTAYIKLRRPKALPTCPKLQSPGSIKANKFSAHQAHLCRRLLFARRAGCKMKFLHSQVTDLFIRLGSRANEQG